MRVAGGAGAAVLLVLCPALLVGCGVPESSLEGVDPGEVPYGLLETRAPGGGGSDGGGGGPEDDRDAAVAEAVLASRAPSTYLLDADDTLVAVPLDLVRQGAGTPQGLAQEGASGPGGVGDEEATALARLLLRRLSAGPSADQREEGLSTALGPGVPVRLVEVVGGTARVNLSQPERDPSADRLPLAVGQAVLTVTSAPGVARVELLRDSRSIAAPLPDGPRSDEPVDALDYAVLLAAAR